MLDVRMLGRAQAGVGELRIRDGWPGWDRASGGRHVQHLAGDEQIGVAADHGAVVLVPAWPLRRDAGRGDMVAVMSGREPLRREHPQRVTCAHGERVGPFRSGGRRR